MVASISSSEVTITMQEAPRVIKTPSFEATVESDGCLTRLVVHGQEFLDSNTGISRGVYFHQGRVLRLNAVEQPTSNVITAGSDGASVRYEFADNGMVWTVKNRTDAPMAFFAVFDTRVEAASDSDGKIVSTVVSANWRESTWFRGNARLEIKGGDKQWGPWNGKHQVWEATLAPGEERNIELSVGTTSDEERKAIAGLVPFPKDEPLTVLSPRTYQVFQRTSRNEGPIRISGRTRETVDSVEARITGKSLAGSPGGDWFAIPYTRESKTFYLSRPLAAGGWFRLDLRTKKDGKVLDERTVETFGVGEVFVGAGQSNSTNCGEFRTTQTTGMVSSFGGESWQLADDPQPGTADRTTGGSFWPAFGDALYRRYRVPIGVATTGYGGTSVNQWQPEGDLFKWTMTRVHQLGPQGFRALLWHQGESDWNMDGDEYYRKLMRAILESKRMAGWEFPWFVAQASYHNVEKPAFPQIRAAQERLWDGGIALRGPDTDTLVGDNRDLGGKGIHFSPKGLKTHGEMWAELVGAYVDAALDE